MELVGPHGLLEHKKSARYAVGLRSRVADPVSLRRMGVDRDARTNVGAAGQRHYLEFHRENVLRMARGLSKRERRR